MDLKPSTCEHCSIPVVMWSIFGRLATSQHLWPLLHPASTALPRLFPPSLCPFGCPAQHGQNEEVSVFCHHSLPAAARGSGGGKPRVHTHTHTLPLSLSPVEVKTVNVSWESNGKAVVGRHSFLVASSFWHCYAGQPKGQIRWEAWYVERVEMERVHTGQEKHEVLA